MSSGHSPLKIKSEGWERVACTAFDIKRRKPGGLQVFLSVRDGSKYRVLRTARPEGTRLNVIINFFLFLLVSLFFFLLPLQP